MAKKDKKDDWFIDYYSKHKDAFTKISGGLIYDEVFDKDGNRLITEEEAEQMRLKNKMNKNHKKNKKTSKLNKFEVKLYYSGFSTHIVEAKDEEGALKIAKEQKIDTKEILRSLESWDAANTIEKI